MHLDLVGESSWQLLDEGLSIRPGIYADVVALERVDERFIPFDRGLLTGVVRGIRPISRGKARQYQQLPLSLSHSIGLGRRFTGP